VMSAEGRRADEVMRFRVFSLRLPFRSYRLGQPVYEMEMSKMMPAPVGMLILSAMVVGLLVFAYVVLFKWDRFVEWMIDINRENPLFKHYEWFYTSGLGKWFYLVVLLPIGLLFLLFVLYGILMPLTTGP
jgi:hypothetical protein